MTKVALLTIGPALRSGTNTAPAFSRSAIDKRGLHPKLVRVNGYVGFLGRFIGIGNRRTHAFLNQSRGALGRKPQNGQSLIDVLTANHIDYKPRLLRRPAKISCTCCRFHTEYPSFEFRVPAFELAVNRVFLTRNSKPETRNFLFCCRRDLARLLHLC